MRDAGDNLAPLAPGKADQKQSMRPGEPRPAALDAPLRYWATVSCNHYPRRHGRSTASQRQEHLGIMPR